MDNSYYSTFLGYRSVDQRGGEILAPLDFTAERLSRDGLYEAVYDIPKISCSIDRDNLSSENNQWRWNFLLPITDSSSVISLAEGGTPLIENRTLGEHIGINKLFVKDESRNPTGSFKDRGSSITISACKELQIKGITIASSGNLAASLASYAARAQLPFVGFIRVDTSATHLLQSLVTKQNIFIVEGGMLDGIKAAQELADRTNIFHAIQPNNLYRIEGKKTIAYEICRDLEWTIPDRVMIPTSGCTNIIALYKGFSEMKQLGWIDRIPSLDIVQPSGCAPLVEAWREARPVRKSDGLGTGLLGLGHPFPKAGDQCIEIIKKTGGKAFAVSDDNAYTSQHLVASTEGLFFQPASTTPIAALTDPANHGWTKRLKNEVVVWIGTGSGKNQIDKPLDLMAPIFRFSGNIDELFTARPALIGLFQ